MSFRVRDMMHNRLMMLRSVVYGCMHRCVMHRFMVHRCMMHRFMMYLRMVHRLVRFMVRMVYLMVFFMHRSVMT